MDGRLRLAGADGLYDDEVESRCLAQEDGLAGSMRDRTESPRAGGWPDERVRLSGQPWHSRLVTEDAAARDVARGIDGQDGNAAVPPYPPDSSHSDESALAHTRYPADPEPKRRRGRRQTLLDDCLGQAAMLGSRAFH